ncbi:hypothetical protein OM076_22900 [Solirubrobacter ginsenosidimutans]|uniref:Uncharacterized protein n=1 Tax=Solirubrobacter ginsenosidimutans TaxID=490573 RepID=A0A9X3S4I7_9ACTN|nr:hypothetical protein [Solirubrobacter ginsenosidimutans]MDA0163141.1 hypothetical protein [Solirubrobacter ginsenosidimutans]
MADILEPGTIDQLVDDAARSGHQVGVRLVRDWTELGLLNYPQRRSAGKGRGSHQALYSANQRQLFLTLLHHRPNNKIKSLARIPVGIWMYWGDQFVPTDQARRAMITWLGDPRVSKKQARHSAQEILRRLDNPGASIAARRELLNAVTDMAYTLRLDYERLERAIRDVFEPGDSKVRKAVGHPAAPMMTDSMIDLVKARLEAVSRLRDGKVTDEELHQARHAHLVTFAEYALQQPSFTAHAPATVPDMYEPVTAETALANSCGHLLTTLGMAALHPDRAALIAAVPAPRITFAAG